MALLEEAAKYTAFRLLLLNKNQTFSWADVTAFMVIVGAAFQMVENMFYAFSYPASSPLRGLLLLHIAYGFIMGWFYGKVQKTGKKIYGLFSFLIPWFLHGLYDFGLSKELLELNDNFAAISISLELVCLICVFLIIRFVRKRKDSEIYTEVCAIKP